MTSIDRLTYKRIDPAHARIDVTSARAQQHWDVINEHGLVIARAEVFEGAEQWGVRVFDRAPEISDHELVRAVAHLLVWHAQCRTETVDVVLARTHEHHPLVRVGGEYV